MGIAGRRSGRRSGRQTSTIAPLRVDARRESASRLPDGRGRRVREQILQDPPIAITGVTSVGAFEVVLQILLYAVRLGERQASQRVPGSRRFDCDLLFRLMFWTTTTAAAPDGSSGISLNQIEVTFGHLKCRLLTLAPEANIQLVRTDAEMTHSEVRGHGRCVSTARCATRMHCTC
jgi:hypothetical protein